MIITRELWTQKPWNSVFSRELSSTFAVVAIRCKIVFCWWFATLCDNNHFDPMCYKTIIWINGSFFGFPICIAALYVDEIKTYYAGQDINSLTRLSPSLCTDASVSTTTAVACKNLAVVGLIERSPSETAFKMAALVNVAAAAVLIERSICSSNFSSQYLLSTSSRTGICWVAVWFMDPDAEVRGRAFGWGGLICELSLTWQPLLFFCGPAVAVQLPQSSSLSSDIWQQCLEN